MNAGWSNLSPSKPVALVLSKLKNVISDSNGWNARCPVHDDQKNSLSINHGDDGKAILNCHAGCEVKDIVVKIGLQIRDLFMDISTKKPVSIERPAQAPGEPVAIYSYTDGRGKVAYQKLRFKPKDFRVRRPDGHGDWIYKGPEAHAPRYLYRLAEFLKRSESARKAICVVEGEKDCETLWDRKIPATTGVGGAAERWHAEYVQQLVDAGVERIAVFPDNDAPGRKHAVKVAAAYHAAGIVVRVVHLPVPENGDVSDYFAAGHSVDDLKRLCEQAPEWRPSPEPPAESEAVTEPLDMASWQVMDVSEFTTWDFPPTEFTIEGLLPLRGLTWIGGRAKRGKSLFMLYVCLAIAAGRKQVLGMFDIVARPKILYLAREDSGGRVRDRIEDIVRHWSESIPAGAMSVVVRPKGFNLASPEHLAWVREQCRLFGYTMVVFDTWTALSPGSDPLGAQAQTDLAQAVARFTEDFDGSTVVIDHSRKNRPEGTTLSSADILGPSQKWQAAETVLMLADTKETGRIEVFAEGKDMDEARFYMMVSPRGTDDPNVEKFSYAGSVETAAEASRLKGGKNCQAVLDAVVEAKNGVTPAQIVERTGLAKPTVTRHLATLRGAKRVMADPLGHGYIPFEEVSPAGAEVG